MLQWISLLEKWLAFHKIHIEIMSLYRLDIVVEPWIEGLWDPLMQVLTLGSNPNDSPECGTELGQAIITGDTSPKIDKIETGKAPLGGRSGRIEADSTDVLASNFEESVNITASSSSSDNIDCGGHETPGEFQVKGQVPITGTGISDDRTEMTKLRTSSSPIDTYFTLPSLSAAYVKVELRKVTISYNEPRCLVVLFGVFPCTDRRQRST